MDVTGKKKDVFPQTLKGLCILFVVLIHLPLAREEGISGGIWISIRQIINFSVATFFFLSAYYTKPIEYLTEKGILAYYKKRLYRILTPYLIWAIIYIFIVPYITTKNISNDWLYYLLTGKGPTYFLLALTQFTILNPILQRYKNHKHWNLLFLLITPFYLIFYYAYNIKNGEEFKPEQFFCFPWFACYYFGLKIQSNISLKNRIKQLSPIIVFFIFILLLILSNIEAFYIYITSGIYSFAISQITVGSIFYSLGAILLFLIFWDDNKNQRPNLLTSLGDYSMGIFLMHPLFNWIYKFIFIHIPGGTILYDSNIGFFFIHFTIWIFSVISSFYSAKFLSNRFPKLIIPFGLK